MTSMINYGSGVSGGRESRRRCGDRSPCLCARGAGPEETEGVTVLTKKIRLWVLGTQCNAQVL